MASHTATDLYSTWTSIEHGHTTQFFDYTHVTWPRHDAARRHSSPLSARHARTHVAQQALGHKSLLRVVCSESRREKRPACDPLGRGTPCTRSVRRPKSDMQHGAPVHPGMCTHTSEHARAFRAQMGRGKLQLQPQRPHGGGRAEKSASPRRKTRFQRPWRQRHLRHTARDNSDLLPSRSRLYHYPRA